MLIDTSVLVALFKDRSGEVTHGLRELLEGRDYYLTRFTQVELLQGARDEKEWLRLSDYLADQDYLEMEDESWANAARLYFDLRRRGLTVRSVIDCCIAEVALRHEMTLVHNDRDFATIAKLRALSHIQFKAVAVAGLHEPRNGRCVSGFKKLQEASLWFKCNPRSRAQPAATVPSKQCRQMPACISIHASGAGWR